jgi:hypothetical protein
VASNTQVYGNRISTKSATGCGGNPIYALAVSGGDGTDSVVDNLAYGYNGNNTFLQDSGTFAYSSNNSFGIDRDSPDPTIPGAPKLPRTLPMCSMHGVSSCRFCTHGGVSPRVWLSET